MKRAGRWLFNIAAAVSLVACLTMTFLWVRSTATADEWHRSHGFEQVWISSDQGHFGFHSLTAATPTAGSDGGSVKWYWWKNIGGTGTYRSFPKWTALGLGYHVQTTQSWDGRVGHIRHWWMSHLHACLLTAVLPALWVKRAVRRNPENVCPSCGYDLRATPTRCPECGTIPSPAKQTAARCCGLCCSDPPSTRSARCGSDD